MDFVREFLLSLENGNHDVDTQSKYTAQCKGYNDGRGLPNEQAEKLLGHLKILEQASLITVAEIGRYTDIKRVEITWAGHDFLDAVRDPDTWKRTKDGALAAGDWTFDLLKDLAKGFVKKKQEDETGVKL